MFRNALIALLGFGLAACAGGPPPLSGDQLAVLPISELPPPSSQLAEGGTRPYYIGPFDVLEIDLFGVPELSQREIQADASGQIAFPLAGTIEAKGMTTGELSRVIENRLRGRYVRDPQITINLKSTTSQVVTVDGEVRNPGLYPVLGGMTLIRAVASAKGLSEFARASEVVIFRTVDGQKMAALYDLEAIRKGQYGDPEVFANDVIVVGDSPGRRLFMDILRASPILTSPIVAAVRTF